MVVFHYGAAEYELRAPHMSPGTGKWEGDQAAVTLLSPVSAVREKALGWEQLFASALEVLCSQCRLQRYLT